MSLNARKEDFRRAFEVFDTDGSGAISAGELKALLQRPGGGAPLTDDEVAIIIQEFDVNGDGELQYEEFAEMWSHHDTNVSNTEMDLSSSIVSEKKLILAENIRL